jgi:hypothetical protein
MEPLVLVRTTPFFKRLHLRLEARAECEISSKHAVMSASKTHS